MGQSFGVEVFAGTAWSVPLPLVIVQPGEPDVRWRARHSTRPLDDAPYYADRFSTGGGARREAELVHHTVYLENPPPGGEHLEVSHGYNPVTRNHARPADRGLVLRFGLGAVVGHPGGAVRGRPVGTVPDLSTRAASHASRR